MSDKAFLLIETATGHAKEVIDNMKQVGKVKSVDLVSGPYDIIAVIEAKSKNDIGGIVAKQIYPIPGILRIVTCLVM
jgi:DNA-binding Lrp family transcriptional regulator